jgi:hypothetical protein
VQLALYFERVAPTVTSEYGILADPNLLQAAQTILGLSPGAASTLRAQTLSELMPLSDLKDPAKLKTLTERFTAMYDLTYGTGSGATTVSPSIRAIRVRVSRAPPRFSPMSSVRTAWRCAARSTPSPARRHRFFRLLSCRACRGSRSAAKCRAEPPRTPRRKTHASARP